MKTAVRAIIVRDGKILVMKRNKFKKLYYVLIGGGVNVGEQPEQALVRELAEETTMAAETARLVYIERGGDMYGDQYIYLCGGGAEGEPVLSEDSEEYKINQLGQNTYAPMWLPLNELEAAPFFPEVLKYKLIEGLKNGFPSSPEEIDSIKLSLVD